MDKQSTLSMTTTRAPYSSRGHSTEGVEIARLQRWLSSVSQQALSSRDIISIDRCWRLQAVIAESNTGDSWVAGAESVDNRIWMQYKTYF